MADFSPVLTEVESWVTLSGTPANASQLRADAVEKARVGLDSNKNLEMPTRGMRFSIDLARYEVRSIQDEEVRSISITGGFAAGLEWTMNQGRDVHLAVRPFGASDDVLMYAIATDEDGLPFFPGTCAYDWHTAPLLDRFGDQYSEQILSFVDSSGAEVKTLIDGPTDDLPDPQDDPATRSLIPEYDSETLGSKLRVVTLAMDIPKDWIGEPNALCTRVKEGWGTCLNMKFVVEGVALLDAYYLPPDDMTLELWLLDDGANLADPLQKLGSIDLANYAETTLEDPVGSVLRVAIAGQLSDGRVESPVANVLGDEGISEMLADEELARELVGDEIVNDFLRATVPGPGDIEILESESTDSIAEFTGE